MALRNFTDYISFILENRLRGNLLATDAISMVARIKSIIKTPAQDARDAKESLEAILTDFENNVIMLDSDVVTKAQELKVAALDAAVRAAKLAGIAQGLQTKYEVKTTRLVDIVNLQSLFIYSSSILQN